jgi:hypothetical protein
MKMTVVTDRQGNIVAAHHGEASHPDVSTIHPESRASAGLLAGPEQEIHVVDVSDTVSHLLSGHEFETHLKAALKKR